MFDPRLSIVKSVFDCHLFGVPLVRNDFETFITGYAIILGVRLSLGLRSYLGHKILILRFLPNKRLCITVRGITCKSYNIYHLKKLKWYLSNNEFKVRLSKITYLGYI